ncbi:hypothetical protein PENTCL1PPCAC_19867, partial [Pristionchus entomophagus]
PSRSVVRPLKYTYYKGYSEGTDKSSAKRSISEKSAETIFGMESHDSMVDDPIGEEAKKDETIETTAPPISSKQGRAIAALCLSSEEKKLLSQMKQRCFSESMKEAGLDTVALRSSRTEGMRLSQLECFSVPMAKESNNDYATPKCVLCE